MWGIRGFVLSHNDGDHYYWVHISTLEQTQVFKDISGIRFIVIQINTSINLGHGVKKANA